MQAFLERHRDKIIGVMQGYDRMLFRGCLRSISYGGGLDKFLGAAGVRYKQFKDYAQRLSDRLKRHAEEIAKRKGRPFQYVYSPSANKEQIALGIAQRDGITEGLICVLRCVEPCMSFSIRRDRDGWGFVREQRKCLFLYFYWIDREFGLMHVRLQTWLPFDIQVCLNGREYLARQMRRAGIGFEQRDNCFVRIDDLTRAQRMMRQLEERKWPGFLNALARRVNPLPRELKLHEYYWSLRSSEYATDVMFRDAASLKELYPLLTDHAIKQFSCHDIMRFLGRRTTALRFKGESSSNLCRREEGVRVKHWVEENSIKMYDKQGSVLRVETTLNNVRRLKVRRRTQRNGKQALRWIPMRKGIMDLPRRTQVCRAANERYLEALGVVGDPSPTRQLLDPVSRRVTERGRPYRALRPVSPDEAKLFKVLLDGRYQLRGFTNREVRKDLGLMSCDRVQRKRQSGKIGRMLRLLRVHGLIHKVPRTRFYRVSPRGQLIMSMSLKLREANLLRIAA